MEYIWEGIATPTPAPPDDHDPDLLGAFLAATGEKPAGKSKEGAADHGPSPQQTSNGRHADGPHDNLRELAEKLRVRRIAPLPPALRASRRACRRFLRALIPREAGVARVEFDPELGEVAIVATQPGLAIGHMGATLKAIREATGWRSVVVRAPPGVFPWRLGPPEACRKRDPAAPPERDGGGRSK